jgi:hypothetical protein
VGRGGIGIVFVVWRDIGFSCGLVGLCGCLGE